MGTSNGLWVEPFQRVFARLVMCEDQDKFTSMVIPRNQKLLDNCYNNQLLGFVYIEQ